MSLVLRCVGLAGHGSSCTVPYGHQRILVAPSSLQPFYCVHPPWDMSLHVGQSPCDTHRSPSGQSSSRLHCTMQDGLPLENWHTNPSSQSSCLVQVGPQLISSVADETSSAICHIVFAFRVIRLSRSPRMPKGCYYLSVRLIGEPAYHREYGFAVSSAW